MSLTYEYYAIPYSINLRTNVKYLWTLLFVYAFTFLDIFDILWTYEVYFMDKKGGHVMSDKKDWVVKDILNYAIQSYDLVNKYNEENGALDKFKYEKKIRRAMKKNRFYIIDPKTQKNKYCATEDEAKFLVDSIMKDYFSKEKTDVDAFRKKNLKKDIELNREMIEGQGLFFTYEEQSKPVYFDKMNKDLERLMLESLFNLFFDFNYESYRKDYIKRENLIDYDSEPPQVLEGYSELDEKLRNPIKYYGKIRS